MKILLFSFIVFLCLPAHGQNQYHSPGNNVAALKENYIPGMVSQQEKYLSDLYYSSISTRDILINGKEYIAYFARSATSPLLYRTTNRKASIYVGKRIFNGVNLQYDTYLDELIYTDTTRLIGNQFPFISLNKRNIDRFILYFPSQTMEFRFFDFPESQENALKDGYYEVVTEDYIIRHTSRLYRKDSGNEYEYFPGNYIRKGESWIQISRKKDIENLSAEHFHSIVSWLSKNGIKIRKITKTQMVAFIGYLHSLDNILN